MTDLREIRDEFFYFSFFSNNNFNDIQMDNLWSYIDYDNYEDGWKAFLAEGGGGGSYHDYYHTDSSSDYSYGFYNSTVTGHDESKTDHKRDENWNVSFDVVNGRAVRETDGDITIIIDESSKYSKSGESHECTETTNNTSSEYSYCNYIIGTRTTHFKRDASVSDSGEQSYYEKITADWSNHANEQGVLEYKISADSEITVKAKGDYSSYLYEYSDNEFDGCHHCSYNYDYSCGYDCGCGYDCSYSYSGNSSLHTYSENERTIDVSEHYDSELHENRHTDGGAFYRVSFDGWANGGGSSDNPTHQYSEYDYHHDWDSDYDGCHSWGSVDNYNDSTNDTSGSASYDYSASWNWNNDGEKSSSVTNQVTGHNGYSHDSYYNNSSESYCDYGCDYSCSSSDSCSYSCTYFDYNESVQYTGWGHQGGQVGSPFSVRWSPFSGSISDGSDCGYGCGCGWGCSESGDYSYRSANFHAPNFSVSMVEETRGDNEYEYNEVWHPGCGSYYYNGYLYSGSAPASHIPSGSAPSSPSAYGSITVAGIPLNYNGNPNFTNYAFVDPEAILNEKYPKPEIPNIPSPSVPNMDDACFVAGTLVLMSDSSMKRIEQIEVGDFVLARNDKLPNGSIVPRRINEIKHNPPSVTYHLKFHTNSGDKEIYIRVTPEHPFYVEHRGWIAVENLNIGDSCVTVNNNKLELFSKRLDPELIPVYNLEVNVDHTYFVGDDPENCVLVHNQYDTPKLQNADTIFDRKIFQTINGKENLEDSLVWTKRIFDIYVKDKLSNEQYKKDVLKLVEDAYNILVQAAINAILRGVSDGDLTKAIMANGLYTANRAAQGVYAEMSSKIGLGPKVTPQQIINDAKGIIDSSLKKLPNTLTLEELRDDLLNKPASTIFDAFNEAQKAEFLRKLEIEKVRNGIIIFEGAPKKSLNPKNVKPFPIYKSK